MQGRPTMMHTHLHTYTLQRWQRGASLHHRTLSSPHEVPRSRLPHDIADICAVQTTRPADLVLPPPPPPRLLSEVKKLDDKLLLVDIYLLESKGGCWALCCVCGIAVARYRYCISQVTQPALGEVTAGAPNNIRNGAWRPTVQSAPCPHPT